MITALLGKHVTAGFGKGTDMSVVINIQLAVPETKDAKVYDAFFESLEHKKMTAGVR